jgi:hypothetical protein
MKRWGAARRCVSFYRHFPECIAERAAELRPFYSRAHARSAPACRVLEAQSRRNRLCTSHERTRLEYTSSYRVLRRSPQNSGHSALSAEAAQRRGMNPNESSFLRGSTPHA